MDNFLCHRLIGQPNTYHDILLRRLGSVRPWHSNQVVKRQFEPVTLSVEHQLQLHTTASLLVTHACATDHGWSDGMLWAVDLCETLRKIPGALR